MRHPCLRMQQPRALTGFRNTQTSPGLRCCSPPRRSRNWYTWPSGRSTSHRRQASQCDPWWESQCSPAAQAPAAHNAYGRQTASRSPRPFRERPASQSDAATPIDRLQWHTACYLQNHRRWNRGARVSDTTHGQHAQTARPPQGNEASGRNPRRPRRLPETCQCDR